MDRKQETIELLKEYNQEHIVRLLGKLDEKKTRGINKTNTKN